MPKTRPKRDKVAPQREGKPERDEPKFRLRPRRPRTSPQGEMMAWSIALKTVYRYARNSASAGRRASKKPLRGVRAGRRAFDQRCAVRITYSPNRAKSQWRAHGVYIAREPIDTFRADPRYRGDGTRMDLAYAIYAFSRGASEVHDEMERMNKRHAQQLELSSAVFTQPISQLAMVLQDPSQLAQLANIDADSSASLAAHNTERP